MKKAFDCVEMKRRAQERIHHETRGLSRQKELAYYHEAADKFWSDIRSLKTRAKPPSNAVHRMRVPRSAG